MDSTLLDISWPYFAFVSYHQICFLHEAGIVEGL